MTRALLALALVAVASPALADSTLRMTTDVAVFPDKLTEDQCLDRAKATITQLKLKVGDAPHAKTATATDLVVMVDCMQSWSANVAHISAAYLASDKPSQVDVLVAQIKAGLQKKK